MVVMATLSIPGPGLAFTQAEIDAAAENAGNIDIDNLTDIASDAYGGRETGTSGSTNIQNVLINELKNVSVGLNTADQPIVPC